MRRISGSWRGSAVAIAGPGLRPAPNRRSVGRAARRAMPPNAGVTCRVQRAALFDAIADQSRSHIPPVFLPFVTLDLLESVVRQLQRLNRSRV
jgi:hypothetical protein